MKIDNHHLSRLYKKQGDAYRTKNMLDDSILFYTKAVKLSPHYWQAQANLAISYEHIEDYKSAYLWASRALHIEQNPGLYDNLGRILYKNNQIEEAIRCFLKALDIKNDFLSARMNLGNAYRRQGETDKAISEYRYIISSDPDHKEAYINLGNILKSTGNIESSIRSYKHAIKIDPSNIVALSNLYVCLRIVCDWNSANKISSNIDNIDKSNDNYIAPFISLYRESDPIVLLNRIKQWSKFNLYKYYNSHKFLFSDNRFKRDGNTKIRIGYISGDFGNHPVGILVHRLFKSHNRDRFEVFTYSYGVDNNSYYRDDVISGSDYYRDLSKLNCLDAAKKVFSDNIDILIDLTGFTKNGRHAICAYKPAPVQISYLGFPGPSGSEFFDYIIADAVLIPSSHERYYSEKIIRLSSCYQINSQDIQPSNIGYTRSYFNLPYNKIVFCSFNNPRKIDEIVFKSWMKILSQVDGSVLWLLANNELQKNNLRSRAKEMGVHSSRLVFAENVPIDNHMERHVLADIALDPFSYNGGITTSLSLSANVPVITLQGDRYISRMSSSILNTALLPELITYSIKEYENKAIKIASNKDLLLEIKSNLKANIDNGPLLDYKSSTRDLEKAYVDILGKHQID